MSGDMEDTALGRATRMGMLCAGGHDKVYTASVLCTWPGQRDWICRRCLTEGREVDRMPGEEYAELKRRKESA